MNKTKPVFVVVVMATFLALSCLPAVNCTTYYYASNYCPGYCFATPSWSDTAIISNMAEISGTPDSSEAYLHVQYHREVDSDAAAIVAEMSGLCKGGVWLYVRAQSGHEGSRVLVCYSNSLSTPFGDWIWLTGNIVYSTSAEWVYVGSSASYFKYIAVCLYSEGNPSYPDHNGIYVDAVRSIPYEPLLGIASTDQIAYPLVVPLYIDGEYVGPTWQTYAVSQGYHTLSVPQSYGDYYFNCWYIDDNMVYTSTVTVYVDCDKGGFAFYYYY